MRSLIEPLVSYSLNPNRRPGFVMANSASDARQSRLEIRRQLIEASVVDVMLMVGRDREEKVTVDSTGAFDC